MNYPASPNFTKHSENLAEIQLVITQVERSHKRSIREGDEPSELAFRKVHYLLVGIFAETRLRKIVDDPTGFNDRERQIIWGRRSQSDNWIATVDQAVRRHFRVLSHQELTEVLEPLAMQRVDVVLDLLRGQLSSVITDRNKLAHGQWRWQLGSGSNDKFRQQYSDLSYNYAAIRARHRILESIAKLVHALCVSEPTFQRDFARLTAKIAADSSQLDGSGYDDLRDQLRRMHRL